MEKKWGYLMTRVIGFQFSHIPGVIDILAFGHYKNPFMEKICEITLLFRVLVLNVDHFRISVVNDSA